MSSLIDFEECVEKGLLRKGIPSQEQAIASLAKAMESLEDAKLVLNAKRYNAVAIMAYLAVFNSARAILFRDGYREKSHACVARYIQSKYQSSFTQHHIDLLDVYREKRHDVQYGALFNLGKEEAENMFKFAEEFIKIAESTIKNKTR
ncbi:HEPN domain-containing protein [Candidatus Micrarchaeota archaeon]|nr:HEPN domain-containing protein [Candidatus Micrarchaeota archaeon]